MNKFYFLILSIFLAHQYKTQYSIENIYFNNDNRSIICKINNKPLNFKFDMGASISLISEELEHRLIDEKFIEKDDYVPDDKLRPVLLSDGSEEKLRAVILKEMYVGDVKFKNVLTYIAKNGSLLFGKNLLNKYDAYEVGPKKVQLINFNPKSPTYYEEKNILTDNRDGNNYRTVDIGQLTWMAENLRFKAYKMENFVTNYRVGLYGDSICKPYKIPDYGYFYTYEQAKNVCPTGWHLPTKEDFKYFQNYLDIDKYYFDSTTANKIAELLSRKGWYSYDFVSQKYKKRKGPKKVSFNAFPTGNGISSEAHISWFSRPYYIKSNGRAASFWINSFSDKESYFEISLGQTKIIYPKELFKMSQLISVRCVKDN